MGEDQLLIQIVINELLRMKDQQNNMRDVRVLRGAITLIKAFKISHGEMEKEENKDVQVTNQR